MLPQHLWAKQAKQLFCEGLYQEVGLGDLEAAIDAYEKVVAEYPDNAAIAAKTQLRIGLCNEKLKRTKEALEAYNELISAYPDQPEAKQAWNRLEHGLTDKDINLEKARIAKEKEIVSLDIEKNAAIEKADIDKKIAIEKAKIEFEKQVSEADIQKNLIVEKAQIEQTRQVQEADIDKKIAIEKAKIEFEIQVKQKIIEVTAQHHSWFATNTKLVFAKLKHINAEKILPVIENFLSEHAIVVADGQTNTLIVRDVEACVGDAITIIEKLDVGSGLHKSVSHPSEGE